MRPRVTTTQGKKIRLAEPPNVSLQVTPPQVSAMLTFTVTTSLPFSEVYPQVRSPKQFVFILPGVVVV